MSLRPIISGFDAGVMFDLLGSKDEVVLARVTKEFDDDVKFDHPSMIATAHEVLWRAIFEGDRWRDLEVEGEPHVMAAIVLARHGQSHLATDSSHWKMPAL